MVCANCHDLIPIEVVDLEGKPVGACGFCGALSRDGVLTLSVAYRTIGEKGVIIKTLSAGDVKHAYSAAATMGPAMKVAKRIAVLA